MDKLLKWFSTYLQMINEEWKKHKMMNLIILCFLPMPLSEREKNFTRILVLLTPIHILLK